MTSLEIRFHLAAPRGEVFSHLSEPAHLDGLTPAWFRILPREPSPRPLRPGAEIAYRLRWRRLPLAWRSRIVDWQPPAHFTYEQALGPYRRFEHEHVYAEVASGGTLVIDRVRFALPGWLLPRPWWQRRVATDLGRIFEHRALAAGELFGRGPATPWPPRTVRLPA